MKYLKQIGKKFGTFVLFTLVLNIVIAQRHGINVLNFLKYNTSGLRI
jgi:hypothetical protein